MQPADLEDTQAISAGRRRRQIRALVTSVPLAAFAVAFIVITGVLSTPSVAHGVPGWLYATDVISCAILAFQLRIAWRLNPKRRAQIIWRANPGYRGRHHEEIDERGVTWTAPSGSQIFVPWNVVTSVRETGHAFHLMDSGGTVRSSLPKRGLASPDLLPVLRDLLNSSAGSRPSAATAV